MVEVQLRFEVNSEIDKVGRRWALSIDEPLVSNHWTVQPEKTIASYYRHGLKEFTLDLKEGEHKYYIATDAPIGSAWQVEIIIPEILSDLARIDVETPRIGFFTIPEVYEPELTTEDYKTRQEVTEEAREKGIEPITTVPVTPQNAWLPSILKHVDELWQTGINNLSGAFSTLHIPEIDILGLGTAFVTSIMKGLGDFVDSLRNIGINKSIQTLREVKTGSPQWHQDFDKELAPIEEAILSGYDAALKTATPKEAITTGEAAIKALDDMKAKMLATAIANFSLHAAIESGSLGQYEFMRDLDPMVTSKFGMQSLIERSTMMPIEKSVLVRAEQEYNKRYHPYIPPYTDLINMRVKEVLDEETFNEMLARTGYSNEWAKHIWDAHFMPPNYTQLLQAHHRGVINKEEFEKLRYVVDLDPRFNNIWDSLIEVIPPYSEIVNERVKEVIDQETFEKYLQWQGYDKVWAKRIWDAHFIPPSLGDLLTAWRRGLITDGRLDELMLLVDLDPRFKEIFDTRKYIDPSVRAIRYMYEADAIDEDSVKELVKRQGYAPEYIEPMTAYITKFEERAFRSRYLTSLTTAYMANAIDEEGLRASVLEAGYSKGVADWILKIGEVRRLTATIKPAKKRERLMSTTELKKAYVIDKIDKDTLRTELLTRGYEISEADLLIEVMDYDKYYAKEGTKVVSLTITQLINAYRYQEISRDELLAKLQLRGLALDEAETLIKTKEKQWGVSE